MPKKKRETDMVVEEPLLSIPELKEQVGVSDFILTAYLSYKKLLKTYKINPNKKTMTLKDFKTDLTIIKG